MFLRDGNFLCHSFRKGMRSQPLGTLAKEEEKEKKEQQGQQHDRSLR